MQKNQISKKGVFKKYRRTSALFQLLKGSQVGNVSVGEIPVFAVPEVVLQPHTDG